jgi:inorganic pyrophosphatase
MTPIDVLGLDHSFIKSSEPRSNSMTNYWHDIPTTDSVIEEQVNAIIEIPEGSSSKYEYDKKYAIIRLDRVLFTSTHYPANYGFIPQTYADDEDPLDILVLCKEQMVPGVLMRARVIGVFIMVDGDSMDEKIMAVSADDPTFKDITHINQLPKHIIDEMTHFFEVYKELEGKKTKVMKFKDTPDALRIITECQQAYTRKFKQ